MSLVTTPAALLGLYLEELLELGPSILPLLPPDAKSTLLAIARRQVQATMHKLAPVHATVHALLHCKSCNPA